MAVRDDFTAGEVLAAADLNDTFASKPPFAYGTATPTTTVEGFIWYDENDTPPTAKFWDGSAFENIAAPGGLVHINTTTFSAQSSVSIDNVFTSTYENYRFIFKGSASAASVGLLIRFRASGTDETGSTYAFGEFFTGTAAPAAFNTGNGSATNGRITNIYTGLACGVAVDVFGPNSNTEKNMFSASPSGDALFIGFSRCTSSTQFDGFTIFPASGNITGTIRTYGYKNS